MDLDDLLEDLWEDTMRDTRKRVKQTGERLRRTARLPAFKRRLRGAALWGSGAWFAIFGGGGVAVELATTGLPGSAVAIVLGGMALPALPAGVWAWRSRSQDRSAAREAEARRRANQERDELPVDVVEDWKRLRRAQVLVEDLADKGYVHVGALDEEAAMVDELRDLLRADRRAADLGAEPSQPLRRQVADVADLLVALAAEAVQHRTEHVGASAGPATLRDARQRLVTLRQARAEVDAVEDDAVRASDMVERARADRSRPSRPQAVTDTSTAHPRRHGSGDQGNEDTGTPRATPG